MSQAVETAKETVKDAVESAKETPVLSIDWKEALYLATRGGAVALDLPAGAGTFVVGSPFDAQCSKHLFILRKYLHRLIDVNISSPTVQLVDPITGAGVGPLDFLATEQVGITDSWVLSAETLEKWWCLGDVRNRAGMWVQGRQLSSPSFKA